MRSALVTMTRFALVPLIASAVALIAPEVHAADPTMADCLGASESSLKLRKDHHLREARQQLLVCAALTCPAEVRAECGRRVDALNAAIPTLVFEAKDAAGNDLSEVKVTMDGKPLADRLEGTAISLDPGSHQFHFEAAGFAAVDKSYVLREGEKDRRERVRLGGAGASTGAGAAGSGVGAAGGGGAGAGAGAGAGEKKDDGAPGADTGAGGRVVGDVADGGGRGRRGGDCGVGAGDGVWADGVVG